MLKARSLQEPWTLAWWLYSVRNDATGQIVYEGQTLS